MREQWGVWSPAAGGFVEIGLSLDREGWDTLARIQRDDPAAALEEMCPDHEEEPRHGCSVCEVGSNLAVVVDARPQVR